MASDRYTRGEVGLMIAVDHQAAIDLSVQWANSWTSFVDAGDERHAASELPSSTHDEWDPVLFVARWREVQDARRRVLALRPELGHGAAALAAAVGGETVRDVAAGGEVSPATVHRRKHELIAAVLEELGGEADDEEVRVSRAPACLKCGERPRARWARRTLKVAGYRIEVDEKPASLCVECLPEASRDELVATDLLAA